MIFEKDIETVWYHPKADELLIYRDGTMFDLPGLEDKTGRRYITTSPATPYSEWCGVLFYVGEL